MALASDGRGTAGLLTAAILLGCAKEMPPPGAHPDELPPSILTIRPAPDSIVVDFDDQLEVRFDEPVRIPNDITRQMFVSPMETYEVEMGFSGMRLMPEDGWREGVVYCYTIPTEGISDLLRNRMEDPEEFCFSTGSEILDTHVGGSVIDVLTGQPPREARVLFWAGPDSVPYGAITDSVGEFVARGLPPGEYEAFGFVDRNRNLVPDRELESYDSVSVVASIDAGQSLHFVLVAPDTTPPLLARAISAGRETVQLEFDDYLLSPQPGEPVITIRDSAAASDLEIVAFLVGSADAVEFPSDSAAVDSTGVAEDSAAVADSGAVAPAGADSTSEAAADSAEVEEDPILPSRFITVRLAQPLDSATYLVSVSGAVNVRRLTGGGDTSFVAEPEPPAVDSAAAAAAAGDSAVAPADPGAEDPVGLPIDSAAGGQDTLGLLRDTLGLPPDTLGLPPDTLGLPPDTLGLPPDTLGAPPDTVGGRRRSGNGRDRSRDPAVARRRE